MLRSNVEIKPKVTEKEKKWKKCRKLLNIAQNAQNFYKFVKNNPIWDREVTYLNL